VEKYGSKVPDRMEDLLSLPGVARKTANIVLANAYGIPAGIAVDTHVKRLSFRLGLTRETDPDKIEKDLTEQIPKILDIREQDDGPPRPLHLHGKKSGLRKMCPEQIMPIGL